MTAIEFKFKFQELEDLLFGFAMKLTRNREDAKDLMQETAMRAYGNIKRFRTGTNFKAWVSTIMHHSFINHYRKRKTRNQVEAPIEDCMYAVRSKTIKANAFSSIMMKELMKMIDQLSDDYRKPFMMHYRGFQYKEIAEQLEVPIGTVKSRIFYARKNLKEMILKHYEDVRPVEA